jgi:hypothetical protein
MATERRYVLENRGQYVDGAGNVGDLWRAHAYDSIHDAYVEAQRFVRIGIRSHFRAVPVERETERTVLQTDENPRFIMWHPTRSPAAERAIHNATLFTAEDLLGMDDSWSEYKIIPVEVTEAPGPWRVVESEAE